MFNEDDNLLGTLKMLLLLIASLFVFIGGAFVLHDFSRTESNGEQS